MTDLAADVELGELALFRIDCLGYLLDSKDNGYWVGQIVTLSNVQGLSKPRFMIATAVRFELAGLNFFRMSSPGRLLDGKDSGDGPVHIVARSQWQGLWEQRLMVASAVHSELGMLALSRLN